MNEKLYAGHTAVEVIELMGMLAAQYDIHSADEALAIARKGRNLLADQQDRIKELESRLDAAQMSLKRYEPVSLYNGYDIEWYAARLKEAERRLDSHVRAVELLLSSPCVPHEIAAAQAKARELVGVVERRATNPVDEWINSHGPFDPPLTPAEREMIRGHVEDGAPLFLRCMWLSE